jgi:hypothetical protein
MATHYQQLERFAQDDKWDKLKADLDRGYPTVKELDRALTRMIENAETFKNYLRKLPAELDDVESGDNLTSD